MTQHSTSVIEETPVLSVKPKNVEASRNIDRIALDYSVDISVPLLITDNVSTSGPQLATSGNGQPPRTISGFTFEDGREDDDHLTPLQRLRLSIFAALTRTEGGPRHDY